MLNGMTKILFDPAWIVVFLMVLIHWKEIKDRLNCLVNIMLCILEKIGGLTRRGIKLLEIAIHTTLEKIGPLKVRKNQEEKTVDCCKSTE